MMQENHSGRLEGTDIPLGLGMSLAQDMDAMSRFGRMSDEEKRKIIAYVQGGATGEETKARIENAVNCLSAGNLNFLK